MEQNDRERRIKELMELKAEYLKLIEQKNTFKNRDFTNTGNSHESQETGVVEKNNRKGHTKTLSTEIGRKMTDKENGFSNAFFIAVISLLFEVSFLLMAFVLFQ